MDAPLETRNSDVEATGPVFLRGLSSAAGRVPIWLLVWALTSLLALAVALPWYQWFNGLVAHRYEPGSVSGFLDTIFRFDQRQGLGSLNSASAQTASILAFMAMLLGVFFAGGWLQIALERTRGQSVRRFLFGGARYFWRFLRVMLLTLLLLVFFGWVIYDTPFKHYVLGAWLDVPKGDWSKLESLDSESAMFTIRALQHAAYLLVFSFVLSWADYTRTRLALQGTYSALWAGIGTFFTLLRHPIKTLRPLIALVVIELLVIALGSVIVDWIQADYVGPDASASISGAEVWMIGLVSQIVLMWRCIHRGARYHVTTSVSQDIVRPLSRPDPWRESIGGPGGPRYPLQEGDEYGVAL